MLFLRNLERVAFGASSFPVATKGESSDPSEVRPDELWDDTLDELSDPDNSPSFKDVIILLVVCVYVYHAPVRSWCVC